MKALMPVDMLAQLVSYYLNDEATIHNNLPYIMDTVVTRSLLKDQEGNEDLIVVRRKWTTRLNSLIQSKQATARWSAIVLIKLTCEQSPSLLFAHIRSWTGQLLGLVAVRMKWTMWLFGVVCDSHSLLRLIQHRNLKVQWSTRQQSKHYPTYSHTLPTNLNCCVKSLYPTCLDLTKHYWAFASRMISW